VISQETLQYVGSRSAIPYLLSVINSMNFCYKL